MSIAYWYRDGDSTPYDSNVKLNDVFVQVSDNELEEAEHKYPESPPRTKDACLYRRMFDSFYPNCAHLTPYLWLPRWSKATDPSSRLMDDYQERSDKTLARDDRA